MIFLTQLLKEATAILEKDAEQLIASKVAKKLGLVYKGFGRWADSKTNKIVAKTIDGKLVKVAPEDEAGQSDFGTAGRHSTTRSMKHIANKLDAPSGVPFGADDNYKTRKKTVSKIDSYLSKNKDKISGNPKAEAKAVNLVKKVQTSRGLRPSDAQYIDTIAQQDGFEGVLRANRLIDDTMSTKGDFQIEMDHLTSPANFNHPDEFDSSTVDIDSLEALYNSVSWKKDYTGNETWTYNSDSVGGGEYDEPVDSYRDSLYDN